MCCVSAMSAEAIRRCSDFDESIGCDKTEVGPGGILSSSSEKCVCDTDLCNGVEAVMTSSRGHVIIMILLLLLIDVLIGHLL